MFSGATHLSADPYGDFVVPTYVLEDILAGCLRQHRTSQQRLFNLFYNYAMSIARRYAGGLNSAEEIVNEAFFKVFIKLDQYDSRYPFKPWFRRIIINSCIDQYRSSLQHRAIVFLDESLEIEDESGIIAELTQQQIFELLDQIPPAYRTVFNLYVVDGYTHEEIGENLNISIGTSKSNLSRARQHIKKLLHKELALIGKH
jgi:RNA polymerase sigma factor (sigma-70 family)